jgi:hypothetical protein
MYGSCAAYCRILSIEDPSFGPLQIVIVGFDTTARFQGEVARELLEFALEDLRRLIDEIGPGDHVIAILVEHRWASQLREAGGRLVGQGLSHAGGGDGGRG